MVYGSKTTKKSLDSCYGSGFKHFFFSPLFAGGGWFPREILSGCTATAYSTGIYASTDWAPGNPELSSNKMMRKFSWVEVIVDHRFRWFWWLFSKFCLNKNQLLNHKPCGFFGGRDIVYDSTLPEKSPGFRTSSSGTPRNVPCRNARSGGNKRIRKLELQ